MAEGEDLVRIQQAHHGRLLQVREASGGLVEDAWDAFAGLDDASAARFSTAAAEISIAAQQQTAVLGAAYLEANDAVLGRATQLVPEVVPIRGGTPATEVYNRSIIQSRRMVGEGVPVTQALESGKSRARSTVRTDVIAQNRGTISTQKRPWVVGYRRVLTGQSCALCATASTQRYRIADLQPIHPSCDCDVAEIYGTEDPGRVVNQQLLDDLQAVAGEDGRPDYWNGPYLVDESGNIRRSTVKTVRDADGEIVRLPNGRARRQRVPGEPLRVRTSQGELGETLTDASHAITKADDVAEIVPLRNPPEVPTFGPGAAEEIVETTAAIQKVPPNIVREALEEAPTGARAVIDEIDPQIVQAAQRNGVTPDEVIAARARLPQVRQMIRDDAARVQAEEFGRLDQFDARGLRRPPRKGPRPAEYDFLEGLDARERARLSRSFYTDNVTDAPDVMIERFARSSGEFNTFDDALEAWLDTTRRYEAAGAVRRGKLPSSRAYSGQIDVDDLIPNVRQDGYSVRTILGADDIDAAAHVAGVEKNIVEDGARRSLGNAIAPVEGPSPYRMSFQAWEEEVRTLEYGLREFPGEMPSNSRARLRELVPDLVDEPGLDYEELYARIVTTAAEAGEEIPAHARIPWK